MKQFHYVAWKDHDVPDNMEQLLKFLEKSRDHGMQSKAPIIVHCSAGAGRTGCYIILYRLRDQIDNNPKYIDIQKFMSECRHSRMEMVQKFEQYKFLHAMAAMMLKKYGVEGRPGRGGKDDGATSVGGGSVAGSGKSEGGKTSKTRGGGGSAMFGDKKEESAAGGDDLAPGDKAGPEGSVDS